MLWALVKGYVARHYTGHRTITELVDQLYEGFDKYGTPAIVSKLVANTDCQATEWAKRDKLCDENGVWDDDHLCLQLIGAIESDAGDESSDESMFDSDDEGIEALQARARQVAGEADFDEEDDADS